MRPLSVFCRRENDGFSSIFIRLLENFISLEFWPIHWRFEGSVICASLELSSSNSLSCQKKNSNIYILQRQQEKCNIHAPSINDLFIDKNKRDDDDDEEIFEWNISSDRERNDECVIVIFLSVWFFFEILEVDWNNAYHLSLADRKSIKRGCQSWSILFPLLKTKRKKERKKEKEAFLNEILSFRKTTYYLRSFPREIDRGDK